MNRTRLVRYAWLSIIAAIVTISLKAGAYWLTNSVGLLSDALESLVNLVAAGVAMAMISIASRPPDFRNSRQYRSERKDSRRRWGPFR